MPEDVLPAIPPPPPRAGRWSACTRALRARWELGRARRERKRAVAQLGAALATAGVPLEGEAERARAAVAARDAELALLRAALVDSVAQDRRDYAAASSWLRPVAIARGFATRWLVRDRLWRGGRRRAEACRLLGEAALDAGGSLPTVAEEWASSAREAGERVAAAAALLELHLGGVGGSAALPAIARVAQREAVAFGKPLVHEVKGRVWPRLPALAGLVVGWWVASTFTDSRLGAALHSLGIGSGPRRAVSSSTLHAMEFWLPVLAAAVCSYLSGRVGALVRARYAPGAGEGERPEERDRGPAAG